MQFAAELFKPTAPPVYLEVTGPPPDWGKPYRLRLMHAPGFGLPGSPELVRKLEESLVGPSPVLEFFRQGAIEAGLPDKLVPRVGTTVKEVAGSVVLFTAGPTYHLLGVTAFDGFVDRILAAIHTGELSNDEILAHAIGIAAIYTREYPRGFWTPLVRKHLRWCRPITFSRGLGEKVEELRGHFLSLVPASMSASMSYDDQLLTGYRMAILEAVRGIVVETRPEELTQRPQLLRSRIEYRVKQNALEPGWRRPGLPEVRVRDIDSLSGDASAEDLLLIAIDLDQRCVRARLSSGEREAVDARLAGYTWAQFARERILMGRPVTASTLANQFARALKKLMVEEEHARIKRA